MSGAGSLNAANYLYNVAPKDGTAFGTFARGLAMEPLIGKAKVAFDATKFTWIGSANDEVSVCVAWHTSGVTKWEDVLARELPIGSTGTGDDTYQFPRFVNNALGSKFKIITGYPGGNDIDLAMERGEVQGRCGWSWTSVKATHPTWLPQKRINILFQMGLEKHPDLPDTPLIMDLARTDEERAIFKLIFARQVMAWPFATPPGVPADRVAALRKAFVDTVRDKDFLADAGKGNFEVRPVAGEAIQALVGEIYATPPAIVQKTTRLLQ
jgi:hypothetical protein